MRTTRIGIVGDFNTEFHTHQATNSALAHCAVAAGLAVEARWVPTPSLDGDTESALAGFDGLLISPGSPYRSMAGALAAIRFARTRGRPMFAT